MLHSPPTRLLNLTVLLPLYPPKDGFLDLVTSLRFIKALIQLLCTAVRIDTQKGWGKSLIMGLIKARHQRNLWSISAMGSLRICLTFQPVERGLSRKRLLTQNNCFQVNVITLCFILLSKLFNGGRMRCWLVLFWV